MDTRNTGHLVEKAVVCPHCWKRFYADRAFYISQHPDFAGDPVAGPMEQRRFAPHEVAADRDGTVRDPKGWEMTERACPECRLQIPSDLLVTRTHIVSVAGAPRSAKTYFLTAMMHHLRDKLARNFGFSLGYSDSHDVKAFLEYEKILFSPTDPNKPTFLDGTREHGELYNTVHLGGVDLQLPKPFIFSLRPTESNLDAPRLGPQFRRNLVLYDNAGESFRFLKEKEAEGASRVTQHLRECEAVFFAFDPLQHPKLRERLRSLSKDPQLTEAAQTYHQEQFLEEVVNRMRKYRRDVSADGRLPVPLVVCLQKYDVCNSIAARVRTDHGEYDHRGLVDSSSIEFIASEGIAGLDIEEINLISFLMRNFLDQWCPEFVALAEASFELVRYFPVSALGTSPVYDEITVPMSAGSPAPRFLRIRPSDIRPFRVTHPMLWLLHRWGLIRRIARRRQGSDKYPRASVKEVRENRIRVLSPTTNRPISLDTEYAGGSIIDPFSGERISIPSTDGLEATDAPSASSPPPAGFTPAPPPNDSLKLKLDQKPKSRKRGWFRK